MGGQPRGNADPEEQRGLAGMADLSDGVLRTVIDRSGCDPMRPGDSVPPSGRAPGVRQREASSRPRAGHSLGRIPHLLGDTYFCCSAQTPVLGEPRRRTRGFMAFAQIQFDMGNVCIRRTLDTACVIRQLSRPEAVNRATTSRDVRRRHAFNEQCAKPLRRHHRAFRRDGRDQCGDDHEHGKPGKQGFRRVCAVTDVF